MPSALARVLTTSMVCGWQASETKKIFRSIFDAVAHRHGFGGGGGFVEQGGVGDVQAGQVDDHGLEIQQGFEAALGDFGLVRRVLGVPAGIFEDVALDDRRGDAVVIAHADERAKNLVLRCDFFERGEHFVFAFGCRQGKRTIETDLRRNGFINECIEAWMPKQVEHLTSLFGIGSNVPIWKIGGVGKWTRGGL